MDKIKALNTKVMAKDFGRVGLGTLAIVAGAFLWGKFLYGRGVRGCQRWMCETFPDEYDCTRKPDISGEENDDEK